MKSFREYITEGKQIEKYFVDFGGNQYSIFGSTIILTSNGKSVDIMDNEIKDNDKDVILKIKGKNALDTATQVYEYMKTLKIKMV